MTTRKDTGSANDEPWSMRVTARTPGVLVIQPNLMHRPTIAPNTVSSMHDIAL